MPPDPLLPSLLLAVLFAPVLGAVAAKFGGRRAAGYFAAAHLILTAAFVTLASGTIEELPATGDVGTVAFRPSAVPGDPGINSGGRATTWSLLTLGTTSSSPEIQFYVGVDGLNLALLALTSLMTLLAILVSWESITHHAGGFYAWLFLLQSAVTGAFLSFDIVLFYVFFELTLIPAFFLIGQWGGGGGRRDAARKFFLYTLLGSLVTLVGIIGVVITNPTPTSTASGTPVEITFSIPTLMKNVRAWDDAADAMVVSAKAKYTKAPTADAKVAVELATAAQDKRRSVAGWLFFALIAGFVVKVPLVPFHTWLPAAYREAPLGVTLFLSAILAKLGTFGMLRVVLPLMPEPAVVYGLATIGTLGAAGIVYAAFCAYAQRDLKMLMAYSSVSHLGFLVLGMFALTPEAVNGALLHMVNHGLTAGAMFALLAVLADRYRTLDATQYGGLTAKYPTYAFFMFALGLAAVGLPGFNSFVSEMLMLAGLFDPRNTTTGFGLAIAAAMGILLSAWYTFTMLKRVFFGPLVEPPAVASATDLNSREFAVCGLLFACCLGLGLYPQPLLDTAATDVARICTLADAARQRLHPAEAKDVKPMDAPKAKSGH